MSPRIRVSIPRGRAIRRLYRLEGGDRIATGDTRANFGKGCSAPSRRPTEILRSVLGLDASEQALIVKTMIELDGFREQVAAGRERAPRVSCAVAKAAADESSLPLYRYLGGAGEMQLPVPLMNVINGGAHANNKIDLQEFMLVPLGAPSFREALRYGAEVFHTLKKIIDERGMPTTVGDEGGFAPNLPGNEAALKLLMEAIEKAGYTPGHRHRARARLRRDRILRGRRLQPCRRKLEADALADGRLSRDVVRQVSDHQHRGRHGGGRLGRVEAPVRAARQEGPARGRRRVRHQHAPLEAGHRERASPIPS
jgi:hypothetical protein